MASQWSFLNVPLALVTGAALASNPRLFPSSPPAREASASESSAEEKQSDAAQDDGAQARAKLGPESAELRALRIAEDQLMADMGLDDPGNDAYFYAKDDGLDAAHFTFSTDDFLSGLHAPDIPVRRHPVVKKYLDFFTDSRKGRGIFATWLKRSGRYRPIISSALRKKGLPRDLEAVVFVESGFWPTAKSKAGAVGLWQFMPATARAYGLTVNRRYDQRRSIWSSSEAAAQHLVDLHARFKSWDLALAAYNFGYANVEERFAKAQVEDFWEIVDVEGVLPTETRRYVPKVLAVAVVLNNLDHYGFSEVEMEEALSAVAFEVPPGTHLNSLARAAGTSVAHLRSLNPELLGSVIPDPGAPVSVHIPRSNAARARVMLPRLLGGQVQEIEHEMGDHFDWGRDSHDDPALKRLAATMGPQHAREVPSSSAKSQEKEAQGDAGGTEPSPSAEKLMTHRDHPPRMSVEDDSGPKSSKVWTEQTKNSLEAQDKEIEFFSYVVQRGDTLMEIAQRFGVSPLEIIIDNRIRNPSLLYRGQPIQIRDTEASPRRKLLTYRVRRGDSLGEIAARLHTEATQIARKNGIENPDLIRIGQILVVDAG